MTVSAEEFIEVWQGSDSLKEVAEKLGLAYWSVAGRARDYRKKGVPLKLMTKGRTPRDWDALAALAEELAPKADG